MVERINKAVVDVLYDVIKILGQNDILTINSVIEQWRNLIDLEPCYATAYLRYQELLFRMLFGKAYELIHVRFDGINTALHGWNGIALSLKSNALSPYRAKAIIGKTCCTSTMRSCKVATKDKYLIRLQLRYSLRCKFSVVHNCRMNLLDELIV